MKDDTLYMRRALQLAACGRGNVSPNPMVGAVITLDGKVIGEGYHRRWGEAHAEVNAVASVADKSVLKDATIYVTLEPCSHYGKTPPCAKLLVDCGFKRVVIGALDPFEKVSGRGVAMLESAGIDVTVGVLEEECKQLNTVFMTAHRRHRPVVTLKWAQSADGWMDRDRTTAEAPQRFSNALTSLLTAKMRAEHDAILTTGATVRSDNPRLTVRGWDGRNPVPVVLTNAGIDSHSHLAQNPRTILYDKPIRTVLEELYRDHGFISVLVEAGPQLLAELIAENLWDYARVEVADITLGTSGAKRAPNLDCSPCSSDALLNSTLYYYRNPRS